MELYFDLSNLHGRGDLVGRRSQLFDFAGPSAYASRPDGALVDGGMCLYGPEVIRSNRKYTADGQWSEVQKKANTLLTRLRSIKYGADLEIAIVRYTRALDGTDYDASLSRLWSVLEYLTGNPRNYDEHHQST